MPEHLLREKMRRLFDAYDVDGNGYIERGDFEALARRINESFADTGSQRAAEVAAVLDDIWEDLASRMDVDSDERVSREEFIADKLDAARGGATASRRRVRQERRRRLFGVMDRDGDGTIGLDEHRRFYRAFGVSAADAEETFAVLDENGDGLLSLDEMVEASLEYSTSADPEARSNDLLGPLTA
ncbi:EF-hand domain-containing protein [Streptomyces sp. NPDC048595]|uniref:EF-hand domain-containing protein n=1 Tax=Streptomyces sp. NPDC048595 TaxID=3365576 RepID=UPI003723E1C8